MRIPGFAGENRLLFGASVVSRIAVASVVGGALVAGVALPAIGTAGLIFRNAANKFNTLSTPELRQLPVRSTLLDRHGHVLAYYYQRGIDRVPVTYAQISPVMRDAIVAIEDSRFYQHGAIDFRGTIRALVNNLEHQAVQGGSTLAQQYVKNVEILSSANPEAAFATYAADTVGRKIRELRMAARVEHTMSKNDILAGYLNAAFFGSNSYGIETAAERYFSTTAAKLTLPQAAMLAGIVEDPAAYDPLINATGAQDRRNTVLTRMAQLHYISASTAAAAEKSPLGLNPSVLQSGCTSKSAKYAAYLCDYVIAVINHDAAYKKVAAQLNGIGGLTITTTLDPKDQRAADRAVNYEMPPPPAPGVNPGQNAETEVMIQPGSGEVRAIAIDRPYGTGRHQNLVDYAVGPQYNGGEGVQIGSTGKVYVLVAALEQGIPFGYAKNVPYQAEISGYTNCEGAPAGQTMSNGQLGWQVHNDESEGAGHYSLYTGTTASINVFFAYLEQHVGLCNVIKAATQMGLTWPSGKSLLKPYHGQASADNFPAFTLGAVNVTPMSVAAADATLPARGIYCSPIAITKIVTDTGAKLPVESANCRRAISQAVADAANYVLQGDLLPGGTANNGIENDTIGRPAASKTGTADTYTSAFFVGYTPDLLGAVWVGNPSDPYKYPMNTALSSCYRNHCPGAGFMYGSMAPGATWQLSFLHAHLASPPPNFVAVPPGSPFFSMGNGQVSANPPPKHHHHPGPNPTPTPGGGNGGGGGGGGH